MARPLYTAFAKFVTGSSVTVDGPGAVAPTPGFQPSIEPFSVSKRNTAEALFPLPSWMTKPLGSVLNTWPVGAPEGMFTTRPTLVTEVALAPA